MSRAISHQTQSNNVVLTFVTSFIGVMAAIPVSMAVVTPLIQNQMASAQSGYMTPAVATTQAQASTSGGSGGSMCWESDDRSAPSASAGVLGASAMSSNGARAHAGGAVAGASWHNPVGHGHMAQWSPAAVTAHHTYHNSTTSNTTSNHYVNSNNVVGSHNASSASFSFEDAEDVSIDVDSSTNIDYRSETKIEDSYNSNSNNSTSTTNTTTNTSTVTDSSTNNSNNTSTATATETNVETNVDNSVQNEENYSAEDSFNETTEIKVEDVEVEL